MPTPLALLYRHLGSVLLGFCRRDAGNSGCRMACTYHLESKPKRSISSHQLSLRTEHCALSPTPSDLQAVGGNAALAVLLTVGTNLAGIFTMPFVLCGLLGAGRQALALAPGALLRNLLRTILAPLLVGAAARAFIPGANVANRHSCMRSLPARPCISAVFWCCTSYGRHMST